MAADLHRLVRSIQSAKSDLVAADRALWGIFGYPETSTERQYRIKQAERLVESARTSLAERDASTNTPQGRAHSGSAPTETPVVDAPWNARIRRVWPESGGSAA